MKGGTFIECSTIEELHAEEEARIATDENLQQQIDECKENCSKEMEQLQTNLDAEIDARLSADKALQALIETEASQRQAADIALQSNIDAEATIRAAADSTLQAAIDTEATQRVAADSALQAAIDTEATARQAADTSLQAAITSEVTQRAAADSALQAAIETYLQSELESMQSQINAIVAASGGYTIAEDGTYHVYTKDGLLVWMATVSSDNTVGCILESDIDMLSASLSSIGSLTSPYSGVFDGNGYTISNATISGLGFFGHMNAATVKDLTLQNISVAADSVYAGGLAGRAYYSTISNCSISATITGDANQQRTGGLVGWAQEGTISNCSVSATITISEGSAVDGTGTGGLVGYLAGSSASSHNDIEGCSFSGSITIATTVGTHYAGGIVGSSNGGVIVSCANKGTVFVDCNTSAYVGGIVGYATNDGTITGCSNSGTASASYGYTGYVAGCVTSDKIITSGTNTNTGSPLNEVGSYG